jgi:Fur family ferric uptake transcriptional regulator
VPVSRESLIDRMRARGLRMTHQRLIVAELLENAEEHLDAEAVYRLAQRKDPNLHRATVYRTLATLKKLGLIDELDLMHVSGDRHFYEIRPRVLHIHLICMQCGTVEEPSGPFWEDMKSKVHSETGFRPDTVRLEMGGLCMDCQSESTPPSD